jgi:hypothetical protein
MFLTESRLRTLIRQALIESAAIGPDWSPNTSREHGDMFRDWVNDNKTSAEIEEALSGLSDKSLGRSGPHNNSHMRKAWRAFGDEFTKEMNKELEDDRLTLRGRLGNIRSRDDDEAEVELEGEPSDVIKTPCIIFTGEFSPASDPAAEWATEKLARSGTSRNKKKRLKATLEAIFSRIPEGHGGTIIIKPPKDGGTKGKAYSCEFGRYGKHGAPADMQNEMNDAFWQELNKNDGMDTTKRWRRKAGIAVPGKVKITNLGSCELVKKRNGNYTITPENAEPLVEKALSKGGYPGTTRNPIIVDGCVYDRALEYAGEKGEWRPYLLIPGLLPKLITNIIGLDAYKYENCGTYALKVALTGVYGGWSRILSNVMVLLAAPETMIRIARVLFPQTWSPKKAVDKKDVLDYNEQDQPLRQAAQRARR